MDILNSARSIRRFIDGVSKAQFIANEEKHEAVNRKLEIIGEAARRLSLEARKQFPDIPWNLTTAMRNILIHDYDEVNLNIVWATAQESLPPLIVALEEYLRPRLPSA